MRAKALGLCVVLTVLCASVPAESRFATGSYFGTGSANSITGLGFAPAGVIIKVRELAITGAIRTTTMSGTKSVGVLEAGLITSMDPDGFTVASNDTRVNSSNGCSGACTYYWVAFEATPDLVISSYTGNGTVPSDTQAITGVGFSVDYVMIIPETTNRVRNRTRFGGASSNQVRDGGQNFDTIPSLDADGFTVQVGADPTEELNNNGDTYHYIAVNEVAGSVKIGTYAGDGAGPDTITGVGFEPEYVFVQSYDSDYDLYHKSVEMPGNLSGDFRNAMSSNRIEALLPDGFRIGSYAGVNDAGVNYAYVAYNDTPTRLYRSVGTNTSDLNTAPHTIEIAGSTVTFSGPMPDNVGVGDAITYDSGGARLAFIQGRTSATEFSVTDKDGGTPVSAAAGTPAGVHRSYARLANWESGVENPNINEPTENDVNPSTNLVAQNTVMMVACYGDGPDTTDVHVSGWTTDADHYTRIFTPHRPNEVGVSQRHNGVWDPSKYVLQFPGEVLVIEESYVRVDGLQVHLSADVTDSSTIVVTNASAPSAYEVSNSILRGNGPGSQDIRLGLNAYSTGAGTFKVWNNLIYDFGGGGNDVVGIAPDQAGMTWYVYNNTVVDNVTGILNYAGTVIAKNNLVYNNNDNYAGSFQGSSTNNLSGPVQTDAPGSSPRNGVSVTFINAAGGDFHLDPSDVGAKNFATNLSIDTNLAFSDDIDHSFRNGLWDIGADEALPTPVYYSIGTNAGDLKTGSPTLDITSGIATFSSSQTGIVGVGDAVTYNGGTVAYINGRSSSTVYSLATADGGTPTGVTGATVDSITRAFSSLSAAQTGSSDMNHLDGSDLVAANVQLHWPCYNDGALDDTVNVSGWTTGPEHYLRIYAPTIASEVGATQRHSGVRATGFRLAPVDATQTSFDIISVQTEFVRIEGLEIDGSGLTNAETIRGILMGSGLSNTGDFRLDSSIIHDLHTTQGSLSNVTYAVYGHVIAANTGPSLRLTNNIVYDITASVSADDAHVGGFFMGTRTTSYAYNNTIFRIRNTGGAPGGAAWGIRVSSWPPATGTSTVMAKNNYVGDVVSDNDVEACYQAMDGGVLNQNNNVSADATAGGSGSQTGRSAYGSYFQNTSNGSEDLHLTLDSNALWAAYAEELAEFSYDIDGASRQTPWDIGADDADAITAVKLLAFEARAQDGAVELAWRTASEIDNLGFHLYRAVAPFDSYERVTTRPVPGLGSSPSGAQYVYTDSGRVNGVTYRYRLEDIDASGATTLHGPAEATPRAGLASPSPTEEGMDEPARIRYGEHAPAVVQVLPNERGVVLELRSHGFEAVSQADGTVRLVVPGLAGDAALPVRRVWIDAVAGRQVHIASVQAFDVETIEGLEPAGASEAELFVNDNGVARARLRRRRRREAPSGSARIATTAFQGATKKALVELSPITWNGSGLRFARRLRVHVVFRGRAKEELTRTLRRRARRGAIAQLATVEPGIYAVRFRGRIGSDALQLSRQGEAVAFHIDPVASTLYFWSEGASSNPYGREAVYELARGTEGAEMEVVEPSSEPGSSYYLERLSLEENRYYQAGLINAADRWLWELFIAPERKSFPFEVVGMAADDVPARLQVWLQGVSDDAWATDHHLRVFVNGHLVAEPIWDGKTAVHVDSVLSPGILREGVNALDIENVGDTEANLSMVMLDKYEVHYPRTAASLIGAELILDVSEDMPRWVLPGAPIESDRTYVAFDGARFAEVRAPAGGELASSHRGADYLIIGPSEMVQEARTLAEHRQRQGLRVQLATTESIASRFGYGELSPDAVRDFIRFAYHEWSAPSIRYVLLLGDATYDFKDYLGTGVENQVPPYLVKTSYLWTASDPAYASVHGDDILPDLAIGRLPARNPTELRVMIDKIIAYEEGGATLGAPAVVVADDSDTGGDFESDADEIVSTLLAGRSTRRIDLRDRAAAETTGAIIEAFDEGASVLSYIGHGAIHLWADENVFDTDRIALLSPQSQQPILLTMNCLNGYFHFPYFDSLAEGLLKAEGKGVIASFAPSGMSLHDPAHKLHKAILAEILSGNHEHLGDALLAAQEAYAATGAFPELLRIYHLLGDPALRLR